MNRLSAHIGYLYTELPLQDRLAAAARGGFTAVEHPEPWAIPAAEMRQRLADLGLVLAQVTSGMGAAGEKGLAALQGREADFRAGFRRAVDYAIATGCPFVHPMAGTGGDAACYDANIGWAQAQIAGSGLRLLIEAITVPSYHLATLEQAMALQDRLGGAPALLFDSYHAAVLGYDPVAFVQAHAARIGHVHIADHPGRHQPGTGTLPLVALRAALQRAGYAGAIGFEYIPIGPTEDSLGFLPGWAAEPIGDFHGRTRHPAPCHPAHQ